MSKTVLLDVHADDPERICSFYSKTFGLSFHKSEAAAEYMFVTTDNHAEYGVFGSVKKRSSQRVSGVTNIRVPSIEVALENVIRNGGKLVVSTRSIPRIGFMAYCEDPEGNLISLFAPDMTAN